MLRHSNAPEAKFYRTLKNLVTGILDVRPNCEGARAASMLLTSLANEPSAWTGLVIHWNQVVTDDCKQYCTNRDMKSLKQHAQQYSEQEFPILVNIISEWVHLDDNSQQIVWQYIDKLNTYAANCDANMSRCEENYDTLPSDPDIQGAMKLLPGTMLTKIRGKVTNWIQTCERDGADIDATSLLQLSHDLHKELSEEELAAIGQHEAVFTEMLHKILPRQLSLTVGDLDSLSPS